MATKPNGTADSATVEQDVETTLLDVQSAAVKRLVAKGKERGYITFDELNAVLPSEQSSSEQIEDVMANLNEMGIQVVESEENEEAEAPVAKVEKTEEAEEEQTGNVDEESLGRTDDPVRMYLREMGTVELLSREGEIAIAKRIEAGRDMMIGGLCESPLTFKAIITWHDQLRAARMLLRDIIDLEATQGGGSNGDGAGAPTADAAAVPPREGFEAPEEVEGDEEGEGAGMSLSALEEKLKPEVLATFEEIEASYKKLYKMQHRRLETMTSGEEVNPRSEKTYEKKPRGTGPQGRPGAPAQQPNRGAGYPAQAAQPAADRARGPAFADGRRLQGERARSSSSITAATNSTRTGWSGSAAARQGLEALRHQGCRRHRRGSAARSPRWRPTPGCRSPSSAAFT